MVFFWDFFGYSVSIYDHFVITSDPEDDGSAFIYELDTSAQSGASWTRTDKLPMPEDTRVADSQFGRSVDVYDNFAIVGATGVYAGMAGAAYIFEYNKTTKVWNKTLSGILFADDPSVIDECGRSVAIHKNTAIFGCPNASEIGYAFIYEYNKESRIWNRLIKLISSDGKKSDQFGITVGINDDFAVVGASLGEVYIYDLRNVSGSAWEMNETTILTSPAQYHDYFGYAIALSQTSNNLVIGAYDSYYFSDGGDAASVYVYDYNIFGINESWYLVAKLEAPLAVAIVCDSGCCC